MFDFKKQDSGYISVPKDFIKKMEKAPGDYIKVYLYGLYLTEEKTAEEIAKALDMTENKIKEALVYWQNKGLLSYNGSYWSYIDKSENTTTIAISPKEEDKYKKFITELGDIFGRNSQQTR